MKVYSMVHEMAAAYVILGGILLLMGAITNKKGWMPGGWSLIILGSLFGSE